MPIPAGSGGSSSYPVDSLDLITLEEAKAALVVDTDSTGVDVDLAGYITAVSRRLDLLCGPIVKRTVTDEKCDGGSSRIYLRYRPVASVAIVTEYSAGVPTTLTEETVTGQTGDRFQVAEDRGVLYRRAAGADLYFAPGRKNVLVTYTAGRYDDTTVVDDRFKLAAQVMVSHLWNRTGARSAAAGADLLQSPNGASMFSVPSFSVPSAVKELLANDILPPPVA